jgi:hypothetical protein
MKNARQLSVAFASQPRSEAPLLPSPEPTPPPTRPSRKIELPWKLARPPTQPVEPEVLALIDPDLAGVPVEFVVHKLKTVGQE